MKNNKGKSTEPESTIGTKRQEQIKNLARQQIAGEAIVFLQETRPRQGWRKKCLEEAIIDDAPLCLGTETARSKEELRYYYRMKLNALERRLDMPHSGRKPKTDEERQEAADMAHELYLKGDKKKYSQTGGKNAIVYNVAKKIIPKLENQSDEDWNTACKKVHKTILRDWKTIYPEDFSE